MTYPKQLGDLCIPSPDPAIFVPSSSELPFLAGVPGEDEKPQRNKNPLWRRA